MARSGINQAAMNRIRDELYKSTDEEQTGNILDKLVPKDKYNNENKGEMDIMSTKRKNTTKNSKVNKQNEEKVSMNQEEKVLELETKTPEEIAAEEQAKKEMEEKAKKEAEEEAKKIAEEEERKLKEKLEAEKEAKRKKQEEEDRLFEEEEFKRMQEARKQYEEEKKRKQEEEKAEQMKQEEEKIKKEYENIQTIKEELDKKQKELEEKEKEIEEKNQEPKLSMEEVQKMIEEALAKQMEEFILNNTVREDEESDSNIEDEEEIELKDINQVMCEIFKYFEDNSTTFLRKVALAFNLPYNYFELKGKDLKGLVCNGQDVFKDLSIEIFNTTCTKNVTIIDYIEDILINKLKFPKELVKSLEKVFTENIMSIIVGHKNMLDVDFYTQIFDAIFTEDENMIVPEHEMSFMIYVKCYEEVKRIVEDKEIPSIIIEKRKKEEIIKQPTQNKKTGQQKKTTIQDEEKPVFGTAINNSELAKTIREMKKNGELNMEKKKEYKDNLFGKIGKTCEKTNNNVKNKANEMKDKYESTKIGLATSIASERMKRQYYKLKKAMR